MGKGIRGKKREKRLDIEGQKRSWGERRRRKKGIG